MDTYKNLGAFLEKKNFNFSPNLIYLLQLEVLLGKTFAATWDLHTFATLTNLQPYQ